MQGFRRTQAGSSASRRSFFPPTGMLFGIVSSTMFTYGFPQVEVPRKRIWFVCMIVTLVLSSRVQIIPKCIIFMFMKSIRELLRPPWYT